MKNMKKLFLTILSMSALMVSACSGGQVDDSSSITSNPTSQPTSTSTSTSTSQEPPAPVTVSLDKTTAELTVGGTLTLVATPSDGTSAVTWSSNNEDVATVANGVVTAVAEGYAKIQASVGDALAYCSVRVNAEPEPGPEPEPEQAVGGVVIKKGETWADAYSAPIYNNPNNPNEVMATKVSLEKDQLFYFNFDETIYRHFNDLKLGGAYSCFAGEDDGEGNVNFKVLKTGVYSFYLEREPVEASNGSIWSEAVESAPVYEAYSVKFGDGEPIALTEIALDDEEVGVVTKKYSADIAAVAAADKIQFLGDNSPIAPGDENEEGKDHNGNNTIGKYPYFYVNNDAENVKVYLKAYPNGYSFWLTGYDADADIPNVPVLPEPVDATAEYYLVGKILGAEDWTTTAFPFVLNAEADAEEYQLAELVSLKAGDALKVMSSNEAYYPEGYGTEVIVPKDGDYQIYFRPAGNEGWTAGGGYFFLYTDSVDPEVDPSETRFFVKGSMNGWTENEAYQLVQNAEDPSKYFLIVPLAYGDSFKLFSTVGENQDVWYPEGAIGYKSSETDQSAIYKGQLGVVPASAQEHQNDCYVIVPGTYFIEVKVSGEGTGIWTNLESNDQGDLMLDLLGVRAGEDEFTPASLVKGENGWQYELASSEGIEYAKDDVLFVQWESGSDLTLELGNDATKALLELQKDGSLKVLKEAKINLYFVLGQGAVKLYAAEVTPEVVHSYFIKDGEAASIKMENATTDIKDDAFSQFKASLVVDAGNSLTLFLDGEELEGVTLEGNFDAEGKTKVAGEVDAYLKLYHGKDEGDTKTYYVLWVSTPEVVHEYSLKLGTGEAAAMADVTDKMTPETNKFAEYKKTVTVGADETLEILMDGEKIDVSYRGNIKDGKFIVAGEVDVYLILYHGQEAGDTKTYYAVWASTPEVKTTVTITFDFSAVRTESWDPKPSAYYIHAWTTGDAAVYSWKAPEEVIKDDTYTLTFNGKLEGFIVFLTQDGQDKQSSNQTYTFVDGHTYKITVNPADWDGNTFKSGVTVEDTTPAPESAE